MSTGKDENARRDVLSARFRQRQLGRGLRLMYEQVLREPIPVELIDAVRMAGDGITNPAHAKES